MKIHLCLVDEKKIDRFLNQLQEKAPDACISVSGQQGVVTVSFSGKSRETASLARALKSEFKTHLFSSKTGKIEEALHNLLIAKKRTLALAESCTGGNIAAHLTALAGASGYFLGSIVAYSNQLKKKLLFVSEKSLKKGAVSAPVVEEMLQGVFKATDADYAIAISGVAGPTGGTAKCPVGTVWAAVGQRGKAPYLFTFRIKGKRSEVIAGATNRVLATLWHRISYGI